MPAFLLPVLARIGLRHVVSVFEPPVRPPYAPSPDQKAIALMVEALFSA
jgi:hypothetical protein